VPTAVVALISLGVLWRFKVPEPILVVAAGIVGLIAFQLFRP
jgi:chromate transporter